MKMILQLKRTSLGVVLTSLASLSRRVRRRGWLTVSCVAVLSLLASPDPAWGRAGGGGGFSGGGGGFSGGGGFGGGSFSFGGGSSWSSGSDSGSAGSVVIQLIVFALIAIVLAYLKNRHRIAGDFDWLDLPAGLDLRDSNRSTDAGLSMALRHHQETLEAIRSEDPSFDFGEFLDEFRSGFATTQEAWSQQRLEPIKSFVSDRIFERFRLQVREQQDLGYRDHMEGLQIVHTHLVEFLPSSVFDSLVVRVVAQVVDYRVSLQDGTYVSGDRGSQVFIEYWSFVRRHGVRDSARRGGLMEGTCPNCGDTLQLNQMGHCQSCEAVVRSGDYDWVLTEITQAAVWSPRRLDEMSRVLWYRDLFDPGFNLQHVEDRASVIFWRKAMADRQHDLQPLMKVASDAYCDALEEYWQSPRGRRFYPGNCSVGGVTTEGLIHTDEFDYCLVEIAWSSHDFERLPEGGVIDHGNWSRTRNLGVLKRKTGVRSDPGRSFYSAQCPSCGAPESDVASHACEFCGEVVNDGSHDWVLDEFLKIAEPRAKQLREEAERQAFQHDKSRQLPATAVSTQAAAEPAGAMQMSRVDAFSWLLRIAAADGKLHPFEEELLTDLARRGGISEDAITGLFQEAAQDTLTFDEPPDRYTARAWLGDMVWLAIADGKADADERKWLVSMAKRVGLTASDVNLLVAKRRSEWRLAARRQASLENSPPTRP